METTRDQLFAAVWRQPLKHLAAEFGVPVSEIVEACRAHHIPRPAHGHWTLVAVGRAPSPPELPPAPTGSSNAIPLRAATPRSVPIPDSPEPRPLPATETDPLVVATDTALRAAKDDERGRLVLPAGRRLIDVGVTAAQRERAVAILDTVVRSLPTVGAKVDVKRERENAPFRSFFLIDGESLPFSLHEYIRCERRERTPQDRNAYLFDRYVKTYHPTGELTLEVEVPYGVSVRRRWADTSGGSIESKLPRVPDALVVIAATIKQKREDDRKQAEARAIERARQEAAAREAARRQQLIEHALQLKRQWMAACELRRFVAAADFAVPPEHRDAEFNAWWELMMRYADEIDPLAAPDSVKALLLTPNRHDWYADGDLGLNQPPAYRPSYR